MKVFAPGKLILSGEHAVVHGKPALAMAVNRYVTATASRQFLPFVSFDLSDLSHKDRLSIRALRRLKRSIKDKYQRFLQGDLTIRGVLHKPIELAQFSLMIFFEMLNIKLTRGIRIQISSDIPMGCGMGSSAATILSIVHALAHHLDLQLPPETFYRLGLEAENMQHGFSSGLDLRISLQGGCLLVHEDKIHSRNIPNFNMYLINTGTPTSSTGECVTHAAAYFKNSSIGEDFAAVTQSMDAALQQNNIPEVARAVRANHQLLANIGVVPEAIQQVITEIENAGGSAKICGAGSISGDQAGMMLVITEDPAALENICARRHFEMISIAAESRGVHVV